MLSAIYFNLYQSKILSSGNGLTIVVNYHHRREVTPDHFSDEIEMVIHVLLKRYRL